MGRKVEVLQIFDPGTRPDYTTTSGTASDFARTYALPPRVHAKVDKNASQGLIDQSHGGVTFAATSRLAHSEGSTAWSADYVRTRPVCDRGTATRTSYSLGAYEPGYPLMETHAQATFARRAPVAQAAVGGWRNRDGSYKVDMAAMESIRRGGGGGEGNLGVRFDVITGAPKEGARERALDTAGPRRSLNARALAAHAATRRDPERRTYNLIAGRLDRTYQAPTRDTAATLHRPTEPALLRTRPW